MYQFLVSFAVQPEHRNDCIRAAQKTARESMANEPGSSRFEILEDETDANVLYLNEVYADAEAFKNHADGPYFGEFFAEVGSYAEDPHWLMRGNRIGDRAAA